MQGDDAVKLKSEYGSQCDTSRPTGQTVVPQPAKAEPDQKRRRGKDVQERRSPS